MLPFNFRATCFPVVILLMCIGHFQIMYPQGFEGYYRFPDIHDHTVYFTAEGDIWKVDINGGLAQRLTTHPGEETYPTISPDGKTLAYSAQYEGTTEIYTMPSHGGLPERWTYEEEFSTATCWTPDGKIIYATRHYSTLPDEQLIAIDPKSKQKERLPLSQASEASFNNSGNTIYFVRPAYHRNVTKRYVGGTARQIWKFTKGEQEAVKITKNYPGESHHPMWWNGRVYFITDRDGTMNIWSIDENGGDLKQHTKHDSFDIRDAGLSNGQIVYQHAADLWHYDIANGSNKKIPITLASDMDQLREKWVTNPEDYITSVYPDASGEKIVITARGRMFVAPVKEGRFVIPSQKKDVRYRDAVFSSNGEDIIALSDESGEFEFVRIPSNGIGVQQPLTTNGAILRFQGVPSPNGQWLAYNDLNNDMWVLNLKTKTQKKISTNNEGIGSFAWSPDSKWIAFEQNAMNTMSQIHIYNTESGKLEPITTDRANSVSPAWSPDGKFIYFLSDRNFQTLVTGPWGPRQPEPYFDKSFKVFHIPLLKGYRSPFRPKDELYKEPKKEEKKEPVIVSIDFTNITERIELVPTEPGNYRDLNVNGEALYLLSREVGLEAKTNLEYIAFDTDKTEVKTLIKDIKGYTLSANGKKLLVHKEKNHYMVDATTKPIDDISKSKIDLDNWSFPLIPQEDWKQIFTDAWRMERDYFYDKNMHGVNWKGMYNKYLPLVDRITTRSELSDLIGRFVGELSALHTSVRGGDMREGTEDISIASLGAMFKRDDAAGGYKIEHIYKADPDYPEEKSPLDDPYLDVGVGDVIKSINGVDLLSVNDIGALLRNQADKQVRINLYDTSSKTTRDIIAVPMRNAYNLRYRDWEYTCRQQVETATDNTVGYVHLRAMGANDIAQWYREFYPVFNRQGLIIDARHNRGGNIDSFILEKLLRKVWMYWKSRAGEPSWNMQYAFRGHMVLLVNENTASDGEALADGFRRLGLGKVIGTRTWGGEIWLSSVNTLSDGGLARAPMMGVYGPEGKWLIEGHGLEPDIVVDNPPHETFNGKDAQLEAAISHVMDLIKKDPRPVPPVPPYPDKSFKNK